LKRRGLDHRGDAVSVSSAGISETAELFVVTWFVIGTTAIILLWPFRRRIGGTQAKGGGPGGSEKNIVGGIWVAAAIAAALWMASATSDTVG
jgi:hypothetical protein